MMVFRSFVVGLLGACCLLLAEHRPVEVEVQRVPVVRRAPPVATIIDVAAGLNPETIAQLVRLGANERVVAVGEHWVNSSLGAGALLGELKPGRDFVDLTVAGGIGGERRVVMLLH